LSSKTDNISNMMIDSNNAMSPDLKLE